MSYRFLATWAILSIVFFLVGYGQVFAVGDLGWTVRGSGTHFEITESEYLNVVLDSPEEISLYMESAPEMITMTIESVSVATATELTISGLTPATTFYKYEDDYHNVTPFTANSSGTYSYTQDISKTHYVFIQPRAGTKFIADNAVGGDCATIGTWNASAKTCILTADVFETIQIDSNGITLDGNGHTVTGSNTGTGVFVSGKTNVHIKNLTVRQFFQGVNLFSSSNSELIGNTFTGNQYGAISHLSNSTTFINNFSNSNGSGIFVNFGGSHTLTGNTANSNTLGIYLFGVANSTLTGNTMSGNTFNFSIEGGFDNTIDTSNTLDGRPLVYVKNASNQVFDASTNAGAFYCINCTAVTVTGLTPTKTRDGVFLWNAQGSRVENVTVSDSQFGIRLIESDGNIITGNTANNITIGVILSNDSSGNNISGNTIVGYGGGSGIELDLSSNSNTITGNNISNSDRGINLPRSSNNIVSDNTVSNSWSVGIQLEGGASGNQIFHNNIDSRGASALVFGGTGNVFSLPAPIGGNYWSKFDAPAEGCNGTDSNDFCSVPFVFSGGQDNFPWTSRNNWVRPPLYTQIASPYPNEASTTQWAGETYANGRGDNPDDPGMCGLTIAKCGCTITSSVMLLRYYGITAAVDGQDVNPLKINGWLNNNNGYGKFGDLYWLKVAEYSKTSPTGLARMHFDGASGADTGLLDTYLGVRKPAILKVQVPASGGGLATHYIVTDGKRVTTYRVRDPLLYNTDKLNESADDLTNHIRDYNNQFAGLRLYSALAGPVDGITFNIASPAELLVTDPLGRRLGIDPVSSSSYSEVPGGSYFTDGVSDIGVANPTSSHAVKTVFISQPLGGDYQVKVIGTGEGDYAFTSLAYDASSTPHSATFTGVTTANEETDYALSYSTSTPRILKSGKSTNSSASSRRLGRTEAESTILAGRCRLNSSSKTPTANLLQTPQQRLR